MSQLIVTCSSCGRERRHIAKGLCAYCYQRQYNTDRGRSVDRPTRTPARVVKDRNEYARAWRISNPTSARAARVKWHANNRMAARATVNKWHADHYTRVLEHVALRRARLLAATVETVPRALVYVRDGGVCGICNQPVEWSVFHLDHKIPLSRGGAHSIENTQVAHPTCNQRKGAHV